MDVKALKGAGARLPGADAKTLRETMDNSRTNSKTAVVVLAAVDGDKVQLAAGVTPTLARSRPVSWSTLWPSRWAAKVASPTWDVTAKLPAALHQWRAGRRADLMRGLALRTPLVGPCGPGPCGTRRNPIRPVPVRVARKRTGRRCHPPERPGGIRGGARPAPAVVLLHGCGGMLDANGGPSAKIRGARRPAQWAGLAELALDG